MTTIGKRASARGLPNLDDRVRSLRSSALLAAGVLCASFASGSGVGDGSGWRWKELTLDVWVEPDIGKLHLQGSGHLVLDAETSSGPALEMTGSLLRFESVASPGARVALGTRDQDGQHLASAQLSFPTPKVRGDEIAVDFECDGIGGSAQFAIAAHAALASWTQEWYPTPRGTDALVRRMSALGVTRFHLPEGWHSVSNGARAESDDPDTELWKMTQPVARSFACAPFTPFTTDVDGRTVGVFRLTSAHASAAREMRGIAGILRSLEAHYGPYPYPTYFAAELPEGVGDFLGSSEQGFIMVRPVAFAAPDGNLALFAHELAHGWWGNAISADGPGGMLLDEALAQFSAVVAIGELESPQAATDFLRFSRPGYVETQCARGFFEMWRTGKDEALATMGANSENSHELADCKGHWMYQMLRDTMGDERFFATLRAILHDFTAESLTVAELRRRFVAAAPELDLTRFFAQWLDRAGAPILDLDWKPDGNRALVTVRQAQPGELYTLHLEIAVDSAKGRHVHTVELSERETQLTLASDGPPTAVELDPRHRLLIWTSDYGARPGDAAHVAK